MGIDLVGNSLAFVNVNFYKSTLTRLNFMGDDKRQGNETIIIIVGESYGELHIHII